MNGISKLYDAVPAAVARVLNYLHYYLTEKISPNEMCEFVAQKDAWWFSFVPDEFKSQEMC